VLPNLIVIGAERSGTTSLHSYLDSHPQVFMSRRKELDFFVGERNWRRGLSWYERQFPTDAPIRGESSPAYTAYPVFSGVPARLAAVIPDAKLVYLVRDPVERTVSALHLARAHGLDRRPAAEALSNMNESPYVARSRYATQLDLYLAHFPSEAIMVVDSEELRSQRVETMYRIFRFLGIDENFWSPAMEIERFTAGRRRRNMAGRALWVIGGTTIGARRSRQVVRHVPAWLSGRPFTSPLPPTVLSPNLRRRLESTLADDAARFRILTGMGFESWCV
jgi:hypothetical protein